MEYSEYEHKSMFEYDDDEKPDIIIKVKSLLGKVIKYKVKPNDAISKINGYVQKSFNIANDLQCLICEGVILDPSKTVKDYKLENGSIINLVVK